MPPKAEGQEVSVICGGEDEPAPSMNITDALNESLAGVRKSATPPKKKPRTRKRSA